ncbi:hypothetical protein [Nocardia sp. NPDC052566]|uniref:DUF7373 family lipoprotein n=1 Tax=Nocardia sp. NPDC052566 TaxID=3364330 RepID=UPI0037C8C977
MTRIRVPIIALLLALASAGSVAACATTTEGRAVPGMSAVDLTKLSTGPFQAAPYDFRPKIDSAGDIFAIESRRMMAYLASPYDVDHDMPFLEDTRVLDIGSFDDKFGALPGDFKPVAERNHFIGGVFTTRSNKNLRARKYMTIALLRFPSEAAARTAATEFAQLSAAVPGAHDVPLGVPNAMALSANDAKGNMYAWRGSYAVLSMATVPKPDPDALAGQFKKALSTQEAQLAQLTPTPVDDILDLPSVDDPMMRLVLPKSKVSYRGSFRDVLVGVYPPVGQLHFERDARVAPKAFADTGVDLVAQNDATVYRTRDVASAFRLQTALTTLGRDDEDYGAPPGLIDARCILLDTEEPVHNDSYLCAVVYGRYVAVVGAQRDFGTVDPAFHQRVAAQYAILAKSG